MIDNRTGKSIEVPIEQNSIPATALKKLAVKGTQAVGSAPNNRPEDELEAGIRVYDPGFVPLYFSSFLFAPMEEKSLMHAVYRFMNTAVIKSRITYINGSAGELRYRSDPTSLFHTIHIHELLLILSPITQGLSDRTAGRKEHLSRGVLFVTLRRIAHQASIPTL